MAPRPSPTPLPPPLFLAPPHRGNKALPTPWPSQVTIALAAMIVAMPIFFLPANASKVRAKHQISCVRGVCEYRSTFKESIAAASTDVDHDGSWLFGDEPVEPAREFDVDKGWLSPELNRTIKELFIMVEETQRAVTEMQKNGQNLLRAHEAQDLASFKEAMEGFFDGMLAGTSVGVDKGEVEKERDAFRRGATEMENLHRALEAKNLASFKEAMEGFLVNDTNAGMVNTLEG